MDDPESRQPATQYDQERRDQGQLDNAPLAVAAQSIDGSPGSFQGVPNQTTATIAPTHPSFVDGQFRSVDPRNISVRVINQMIGAVVLLIVCLSSLLPIYFSVGANFVFWTALAVALVALLAAFMGAIFWPKIDYRHTRFRIDAMGIEIHHGVLWRHRVCVPIGRVQHADVSQGPIQRLNGVGSLVLHTAGTTNASVSIDGFDHQFAVEVRDWIVQQRKAQDAV